MKKIDVKLKSSSYPVFVGKNILREILKKNDWGSYSKILIITDSNVNNIYRDLIPHLFKVINNEKKLFVINAGENSKSYVTLKSIYSFLISNGFGRDSFIIALGGGVVGDISGFAASSYMRGIQYCQIPTTLLAMVDSSIGGKTGINLDKTKNIVGSFYQPDFVAVDLNFLDSLPQEEWICGMGEILKYCFLSDYKFFNYLNNNFNGIWNKELAYAENLIVESVKIKSSVVSADEKEKGLRKILNLGHTFAHGFESALNYKIKHGEAVVAGIGCAVILSNKLGVLDNDKLQKFSELIKKFKISLNIRKMDKDNLYNAMLKDKKNRLGKIKFILIKDVGQILTDVEVSKSDVLYALENFNSYFNEK